MNNERVAKRLPIDIPEALRAICAYGKGRCWHCDVKLPAAERAIRAGWNGIVFRKRNSTDQAD